MERRPLLLNSVLLRQNPHNVVEWQKRVTLLEGKPRHVLCDKIVYALIYREHFFLELRVLNTRVEVY